MNFCKVFSVRIINKSQKNVRKNSSHLNLGNQSSALHFIIFLFYKLCAKIICYYINAQMVTGTLECNKKKYLGDSPQRVSVIKQLNPSRQ